MAVQWRLKTYLSRHHGIYRPTDLQKLIVEKTNIIISLPNLSKLLNHKPNSIRFKTMELLCTSLECNLYDFCEITPSNKKLPDRVKKLSPQNIPHAKKAMINFPDPGDYE